MDAKTLALIGLPLPVAQSLQKAQQAVEVYAENWAALRFFTRLATQWRYSGGLQPQRVGLDYAGVRAAMQMDGVVEMGQMFADIQIMEQAVLGTSA